MSLSVCEHTSVGVKAYSFVNGNWKALFAAVKSRVQLFQTGSVVLRSEQVSNIIENCQQEPCHFVNIFLIIPYKNDYC